MRLISICGYDWNPPPPALAHVGVGQTDALASAIGHSLTGRTGLLAFTAPACI